MEFLDKYKIIGDSLEGGMGQVFHMYHPIWKHDLAMKQPLDKYLQTDEQKEMFVSECEKWMSLGAHPHIVQCFYVGEHNDKMSAFMEWMPKGSLKQLIDDGSIYNGNEKEVTVTILKLALQMAIGLNYSHSKGVLHLDMKPQNVLVKNDLTLKISDFGLASYNNTQSDKIMYTQLYCAPEQVEQATLNETTDIYCYGITLLHLLCGETMWFDGISAGKAHNKLLNQYSKIQLPKKLQQIMDGCLQRYQEDRYQTFEPIVELLMECLNKYNEIFTQYPEFYENDSYVLNNMGISYFNLNKKAKARKYWCKGYEQYPYHLPSYFNYQLFNYFYDQNRFDAINHLNKDYSFNEKDYYHLYLLSRFHVSTGAYERARKYASQAFTKAFVNHQTNAFLYLDNETYIKQRYEANGPKVIFESNLKKAVGVDSLENDCLYLGMINEHSFIYVSKKGIAYKIDLKNRKFSNYNLNLKSIQNVCMSINGRYIALCEIDEMNSKDNKIYHIIKVYDLSEDNIKVIMNIKGYYEKCKFMFFINQTNEIPTLVVKFNKNYRDFSNYKGILTENTLTFNYLLEGASSLFSNVIELYGDFYFGIAPGYVAIFDSVTKDKISERYTLEYKYVKAETMRFCQNSNFIFFINDENGYSVYDTVYQCFICKEKLDENISHLTISPDGKTMGMIQNDKLVIRKIPDYNYEEKILWEMNHFKNTNSIMKDVEKAKQKEKEAYILLNEENLNVTEINNCIKTVRNVLNHENYLKLAAILASKIGFNEVRIKQNYKYVYRNEIDYYPKQIDGTLTKDLKIKKTNSKYENEFIYLKTSVIKLVAYEDILGITKDYCYLVINNKDSAKYTLIELEWINR